MNKPLTSNSSFLLCWWKRYCLNQSVVEFMFKNRSIGISLISAVAISSMSAWLAGDTDHGASRDAASAVYAASPETFSETLRGTSTETSSTETSSEDANAAFFRGDFETARAYCESLLKSADDKKKARICINLGACYFGMKQYSKAENWFNTALKLLDKVEEGESRSADQALSAADCRLGLAECHYMQGRSKTSLKEYASAMSLYEKALGPLHPETIPAIEGLAGSYYVQGDYDSALPLYEHVARIDLVHSGPASLRLGLSLNSLSEIYYQLNDCSMSRKFFEQALWIFKLDNAQRLLKAAEVGTAIGSSTDISSTTVGNTNTSRATADGTINGASPEKSDTAYGDATALDTMRRRINDVVMGTTGVPDIAKTSFDLLKQDAFDFTRRDFKMRANDFDNWRFSRRNAEETVFISIDPNVEQKALIICLHGLGLQSKSFKDFAEKITPFGYSVIALDVRGFGSFAMEKGLDKLDLDTGLEDLAASVSLFRAHNPKLPIVILGESMGGALALQLAAKHPELVNALVSAVPSGKRFKSTQTSLLVGFKLLEDKKKPIAIGKRVIEQSTEDESVRMVWMNDPGNRLQLSAEELMRFQNFMKDTEKYEKDIKTTPVIIFQGFKDHLVKSEGTIALYGALGTSQKDLVLVGDSEHLIFEEGQAPDDIVRMLAGWLDSHIAPGKMSASSQNSATAAPTR